MDNRYASSLVATGGAELGELAYRAQVDNLRFTTEGRATASVGAGWAFLAAGLVAWFRRPANRIGPLLMVVGFALLARQLRYEHEPVLFTTFFLVGELPYALFAHAALAYPAGRVTDRLERAFLVATYAVVILFPLTILLVYDGTHQLRYFDPSVRKSMLFVAGNENAVRLAQNAYAVLAYGVLALVFVALIARKLYRATPRTRRILTPLLLAAAVAAMRAVFDSVLTFVSDPPGIVYDNLFWWQITGVAAVPIAMLAGLLRARLARLTVAGLVVDLEDTPPHGIRDALARALDDPTLEVAFWLPERAEFVDADGAPVVLPEDGDARAVTLLEHDGHRLAALVHDPSLRDERKLVEAAGAAARLALENARLNAEVQAQLAKVTESRARLVAAGDEQRRRIERALHDGAQQTPVALPLELRRARRELGGRVDPELERLLASTADGLHGAVQELRELAAGIHPPILTQGGLAVALEALAQRAPVPVAVDAELDRLPPEIEGTAYFVASEALTNVAKHAAATRATVSARRLDGMLRIEVADDGVGGATTGVGTGLGGLADRVEALGGRLLVESRAGRGTRVIGEIPCES
jgi:signal transduction histidine kinase